VNEGSLFSRRFSTRSTHQQDKAPEIRLGATILTTKKGLGRSPEAIKLREKFARGPFSLGDNGPPAATSKLPSLISTAALFDRKR
jgi:hypothetical protein